jgi:hypothetical protein
MRNLRETGRGLVNKGIMMCVSIYFKRKCGGGEDPPPHPIPLPLKVEREKR